MSKENNIQDLLHDVADAIREKKGTEELINPQDFSNEIKNLPSGSSPFAVDFGDEIASGNPYTLDSLADDIAYYNQIQEERRLYAERLGGRSDTAILADPEFKEKIAWWPKGMAKPNSFNEFFSLKEFDDDTYTPIFYTGTFSRCAKLTRVRANFSSDRAYQMFYNCSSLERVEGDLSKIKNAQYAFYGCSNIGKGVFDYDMPLAEDISLMLASTLIRKAIITSKVFYTAYNLFYNCASLREAHIDISHSPNIGNMFDGCWTLELPYVKGWTTGNIGINNFSKIKPEGIHYIIQNAVRSDTTKTLALQAVSKANWEASEYYEEDLVKAQELNITIA